MLRNSDRFFYLVGLGLIGLGLIAIDAVRIQTDRQTARSLIRQRVVQLELTDLALFTEARYTRHPSQSDLHAAFQDHPMALEHFPSGSLLARPVPYVEPKEIDVVR